jgi:hypothetical protein
MSEADNENRVRAFYEATVPGHREALRGIQDPHVIYDMPAGMPFGCGACLTGTSVGDIFKDDV